MALAGQANPNEFFIFGEILMIIVKPEKLRIYKKENMQKENRLHRKAKFKAKKIARLFGLKLREEAIFNPYILDLYIPKIRVGIEIDGGIHEKTETYDNRRDNFLAEQYGITVLRFTDEQIQKGMFKIVIWECCYNWLIANIKSINKRAELNGIKIPNEFKTFIKNEVTEI